MSRHTIATLQRKLKDTQQDYQETVASLDKQLKELHQATDPKNNGQDGHFVLAKDEVTRAYDRLKAQAILEGGPGENVSFIKIFYVKLTFFIEGNSSCGRFIQ
jgi:cytokinesis protein